MESYIASQRESIFRNVEVLIYVFDVESRELERDFHYYQSCLEAILQNSADAKIFCLIHKMDLIHQDEADRVTRCLSLWLNLALFRLFWLADFGFEFVLQGSSLYHVTCVVWYFFLVMSD